MKKIILSLLSCASIMSLTCATLLDKDVKMVEASTTTPAISKFAKTSDSIDEVISYSSHKGKGSSTPLVETLSKSLKLYNSMSSTWGNYLKIFSADGYAIESVTISFSLDSQIAYSLGDSEEKSKTISVSAYEKYTINDVNSNSINIYNAGYEYTYVNYLEVKYYEADSNFNKLPKVALKDLLEKYILEDNYTKRTTINLDSESTELKKELVECGFEDLFHAKKADLKRTTYYYGGELLMTNDEESYNSGYGIVCEENIAEIQVKFPDAEIGDMTHFTYSDEKQSYDYIVKKSHENWDDVTVDGEEGFYVTPKDFLVDDYFDGWEYNEEKDEYSLKVINSDEIVSDFLNVVAPLILDTVLTSNYIDVNSLVIKERENNLILQIISNGDSGKLIDNTNVLAEALIEKGCDIPFSFSKGMEYTLLEDGNSYSLTGLGTLKEKDVIIPSTYNNKPVTHIAADLFRGYTGYNSVYMPNSVTNIGNCLFMNCKDLEKVKLSSNLKAICYSMFEGCSNLKSVAIPEQVTNIGAYAFKDCTNLESVQIPESLLSIGLDAFHGCEKLSSINLPQTMETISSSAFEDCASLESITLPEGIETIETYLFRGCSNLKTIIIPEGVKTIEGQSFKDCTSLESVIIPNSVTTIEASAFSQCNALKTVYYSGSQSEWESIDISSDYDGNKTLTNAKIEYNYSL